MLALKLTIILTLVYLIGSIPFGFLIGRLHGIDIRKHGSGNIGATNVRRVIGKDYGIVCFVLDFLKGLLPVLWSARLFAGTGAESWAATAAAALTVLGHCCPLYLKFKGGKGVSTTLGSLIALAPVPVFCGVISWVAVFHLKRIVSVASLAAAVMIPLSAFIMRLFSPASVTIPELVALTAIAALIIVRHRENIVRLMQGKENSFRKKGSGK